jgi:hypothetical protein
MGLELSGVFATLMDDTGEPWPDVDEQHLMRIGATWLSSSGVLSSHASLADSHAQQVWTANVGEGIAAFERAWKAAKAPSVNLHNASSSSAFVGVAMLAAAAIVLGLKLTIIAQLAMLLAEIAEAIATAPETLGLSLAEIPAFKEVTSKLINLGINLAINGLMQA